MTLPLSTDAKRLATGLLILASLILAPWVLSAVAANAQSFDCARAHTSAQFAICNDEELLDLDERLAIALARRQATIETTPQLQALSREQLIWLRRRDDCRLDWNCLKLRYRERIGALNRSG